MGLESATFIHQLDPNNPVGGSDPKSQGDDHFHLIKETLQNTFPNVEGEVTASHTELNILDGVTASAADINKLDNLAAAFGEACMCEIAFVHCNSAGAILRSHNVDSVTVGGGTGQRTVNFAASLPDFGFAVGNVVGQQGFLQINNQANMTSVFVQIWNPSSGVNAEFVLVAFFPKFTVDDPT